MKLLPSSLYKEGGVVHDTPGVSPTTPQDLARRISGHANGAERFGRHTLVSVVDGRICDKAFRVLALLECCAWDGAIRLAFEEIAGAVDSSRSQVIRHVKLLEEMGYLTIRRAPNQRNEYSVKGITGTRVRTEAVAEPVEGKKPIPVACPKCLKRVPSLLKVGCCRACNWRQRVEKIADQRIDARTA